jgi:hypothetical protein
MSYPHNRLEMTPKLIVGFGRRFISSATSTFPLAPLSRNRDRTSSSMEAEGAARGRFCGVGQVRGRPVQLALLGPLSLGSVVVVVAVQSSYGVQG